MALNMAVTAPIQSASVTITDIAYPGERRKERILNDLAIRREVYVNRARRALLKKILREGVACADDVYGDAGIPEGIDPRCLGTVPGPLARLGIIRRTDFAKSNRPERHASFISRWSLANPAKASQWLATHPDLGDDVQDSNGGDLFNQKTTCPTVTAAGHV